MTITKNLTERINKMTKKINPRQLQSKNPVWKSTIALDQTTKIMFDLLTEYSKTVCGLEVSASTLVRTAIGELFLSSIEAIYRSYHNAPSKQEVLNRLMQYHELHRQKLLRAAGKESNLPNPLDCLMESFGEAE